MSKTSSVPILRTSERGDFLRCQQRWWWRWREGFVQRGYAPDALWFGTGIHVALAAWYCGPGTKRGPEPAETWADWSDGDLRALKTTGNLDDESEVRYVDAKALGIAMLEGYRKLYGRDEHKLIISPEQTFKLRVPWPADQSLYPDWTPDVPLFDYCGTYDCVWRDASTGRILLDEHKTAATISTGHLALDPQAGSYWAMAGRTLRDLGLIGPRERLAGIEYNFLRKALPDDRPKDAQGYATNKPVKADYHKALGDWLVGRREVPVPTDPPLARMKLEQLAALASEWGVTVLGERSKVQPAALFLRHRVYRTSRERNSQLVRLQREGLQMVAIKDGVLPLVKNPTRDCSFCPYYEVCELDEAGGDTRDLMRASFRREDPYADHR